MSNKVEFIEKKADGAIDEINEIIMSLENASGLEAAGDSDLVVFEEDLDEETSEDGLEFAEDIGEESGDLEVLDVKEFSEDWSDNMADLAKDVGKASVEYGEDLNEDLERDGLELAISEDGSEFGVLPIPGSEGTFEDSDQESDVIDSNWKDNRDSAKFMPYIESAYPSGIPNHDGNSMVGCEVALLYLNKLNKEISEAIRTDSGESLDPLALEDYRVKILKDMVLLKERMNNLKRDLGDATRQMTRASDESSIEKTATTPRVQIVATPFERAVAGILINAVVSAGHPFEDVYDYLSNKYAFSERDELSIMQLVMDSGYHIFKDRGTISSKADHGALDSGGNPSLHGIDFIKNYFA